MNLRDVLWPQHRNNICVHLQHSQQRRSGRDERCTAQRARTAGWATTQVICSDLQAARPGFPQQGICKGQSVLHNNTVLPKAFSQCHSSEFRRVKPAGEEGRREQTEWRVTETKHKAGSLASELVINHLKWYVLADFRVIFSFSLAEHEFHRSLEPTAALDLLAPVSPSQKFSFRGMLRKVSTQGYSDRLICLKCYT